MIVRDATEDPVAAALVALSKRNDDAFVIFTAEPTERYVQFSVRGNRSIYFDFPVFVQNRPSEFTPIHYDEDEVEEIPREFRGTERRFLSGDEEARLKAFLDKNGISYKALLTTDKDPDGIVTSYMQSIRGDLTIPVSEYETFVQNIFQEVYLLTEPWQLHIEED